MDRNAKAGIAEARISSGSITFAGVVADKLVTSSTSGPTRLEGCIIRELDMHASSGNVTSVGLDAGTAAVGVTSGNVSLELAVADPTLYRLELSSTSGSITVSGGGYETSAFRNLRLGIGGQLIKIGVSSGNIAVRFKDAAGQ